MLLNWLPPVAVLLLSATGVAIPPTGLYMVMFLAAFLMAAMTYRFLRDSLVSFASDWTLCRKRLENLGQLMQAYDERNSNPVVVPDAALERAREEPLAK